MSIPYGEFVAPDDFIGEYMAMMEGQETARAYDFWCAAWLLSVAIGRGCIVDRPRAPVFMNLYCVLTADSGVTRKSSAIRCAAEIAKDFAAKVKPQVVLVDGPMSLEAFTETLALATEQYGESHAGLVVSELATSLGRGASVAGLPVLLTDLYDCPSSRSGATLARGSWELKNVYLSFLSASTPSWLIRAVSPDVIEGGFTSRCLFIHSERRKRPIPWPEKGEDEKKSRDYFVDYLLRIRQRANLRTAIGLDDGARRLFSEWYVKRKSRSDSYRASFASREDAHVLRLAAIMAVSRDAWVVEELDIRRAVRIIESVREDGAGLFSVIPDDPNSGTLNAIDKVRRLLLDAGINGIKQRDLAVKCGGSVLPILEVMHELKMVDRFEVKLIGRPSTWWRATRYVMEKSVSEILTLLLDPATIQPSSLQAAIEDYEPESPRQSQGDRGIEGDGGS